MILSQDGIVPENFLVNTLITQNVTGSGSQTTTSADFLASAIAKGCSKAQFNGQVCLVIKTTTTETNYLKMQLVSDSSTFDIVNMTNIGSNIGRSLVNIEVRISGLGTNTLTINRTYNNDSPHLSGTTTICADGATFSVTGTTTVKLRIDRGAGSISYMTLGTTSVMTLIQSAFP